MHESLRAWKQEKIDGPKHGHEGGVIVSVRDKIGVVEEQRSSVFQRRHFRQNPIRIDLVHGHVLILKKSKKLYFFRARRLSCT